MLLPSPSSMRATASTPAGLVGALVARFPASGSLPRLTGGSAPALLVSRPARRSLALWPAWSLGRPRRPICSECFRPCRYLHHPLRLLPAGATVAGRNSHPLRDGAFPRHTVGVAQALGARPTGPRCRRCAAAPRCAGSRSGGLRARAAPRRSSAESGCDAAGGRARARRPDPPAPGPRASTPYRRLSVQNRTSAAARKRARSSPVRNLRPRASTRVKPVSPRAKRYTSTNRSVHSRGSPARSGASYAPVGGPGGDETACLFCLIGATARTLSRGHTGRGQNLWSTGPCEQSDQLVYSEPIQPIGLPPRQGSMASDYSNPRDASCVPVFLGLRNA